MAPLIPSTRARGMTLLELLLSLTLLASMSALLAGLWSQSASWSGDSVLQQRGLRLARVVDMLQAQFASRRVSVSKAGDTGLTIQPRSIEFITTRPMMLPDWPVVRVRYSIETFPAPGGGGAARSRLKYQEAPVTDLAEIEGQSASTGDPFTVLSGPGAPAAATHVLLDSCDALEWQRFGMTADAERSAGSEEREERAAVDLPEEDRRPRWRAIDQQQVPFIPAIRLAGVFEEQEFTCVLVVAGSR